MVTNSIDTFLSRAEILSTAIANGVCFIDGFCPAFFDRYGLVMTSRFVVYPLVVLGYRNDFCVAVTTVRTGIGTNTFCYAGRRSGYGRCVVMTDSRDGLRIAVVANATGVGTFAFCLAARLFGYRKGVAVFAGSGNRLGFRIATAVFMSEVNSP